APARGAERRSGARREARPKRRHARADPQHAGRRCDRDPRARDHARRGRRRSGAGVPLRGVQRSVRRAGRAHRLARRGKLTEVSPMSESATEQAVSNDDWAAALNEQNAAAAGSAADMGSAYEPAPEARAPNPAVFEQLNPTSARTATRNDIDLVLDIPVQLTVELGRTKLPIRNLLQLAQGSVVELDGLAGEPMDVLVNGCL